MLSAVVHAELPDEDPPRLSDDELSAFFSLLFSAGAETTRNAIAGAMLAFLDWPDQLALLRAGDVPMAAAVEEILRWTTPSPSKRRTATARVPARRADDRTRAEGGGVGGLGQPRRTALHRSRRVPPRARSEPASQLRARCPFLPWRTPRPPRDPRGPRRGPGLVRPVRTRGAGRRGPAATATRASATCPCGCRRVAV